ncbi:MAG: pyridoxamine 5'-phosphate oxidase family protein [Clostridiaceae bacterium]
MRREDKQLSGTETLKLLTDSEYGVLSMTLENGYSYGVPLNYVFFNNNIYFHCATEGVKLSALKHNPKVSFCVVNTAEVIAEKFSTSYKSVIAFGTGSEVLSEEIEKETALLSFIEKYSPEFLEKGKAYIAQAKDKTKVYKIQVEHVTGKGKIH